MFASSYIVCALFAILHLSPVQDNRFGEGITLQDTPKSALGDIFFHSTLNSIFVQDSHAPRPRRGGPPPELKKMPAPMEDTTESNAPSRALIALSLFVIFGLVFLVLLYVYKVQVRELELPEDERGLARMMAQRGTRGPGISPTEMVFSALDTANGWITAGRVATSSGIPSEQVAEILQELLSNGRIKSGKDKEGRRLFRVNE